MAMGYFDDLKEERKKELKRMQEARGEYKPSGRRIKVREMRPGYVYTFADMTMEEYAFEHWLPYYDNKERCNLLSNQGVLTTELACPYTFEPDVVSVQLAPMAIENHCVAAPTASGKTGYDLRKTGKRVWYPYLNYKIYRDMNLDDEIIEVHPFRIGIYKPGSELELIPNPDSWVQISPSSSNYSAFVKEEHVSVWDETDVKVTIVVAVIGAFMFMCGPGGIPLAGFLWGMTGCSIFLKHRRIRREVIEQRRKRGIVGDGADELFR